MTRGPKPQTITDPTAAVAERVQRHVAVLIEILDEARATRDEAVLALLAAGHGPNAIARRIGVVEGTVRAIRAKA